MRKKWLGRRQSAPATQLALKAPKRAMLKLPSTAFLSSMLCLHRFAFARRIARRLLHGLTLRQGFHGGSICLDAVEHSWAWTGKRRYETFDRPLQDRLLSLSSTFPYFIDVGCNIGAMALSVLLRNPSAMALCIDPNSRAIRLCRESVRINHLEGRIIIEEAAVTDHAGVACYDDSGSVLGHISEIGKPVKSLDILAVVDGAATSQPCLVKIDVEGYELCLLKRLAASKLLRKICLVVELHPRGFNGFGDPESALAILADSGAHVCDLNGVSAPRVINEGFSQVICAWR
jgi:FkbM family methyltransferase